MFCRNCGKEVDNEAIVCPSCGKPIYSTAAPDFDGRTPSAEPVFEHSVGEQNPFNTAGNDTDNRTYRAEEPKESPALSIVALCLGIASLVLCCCGGGVIGIAGIIVSAIALSGNKPGRGMAVGGLVTSIIGVIFFGIITILSILGSLDYGSFYDSFYDGYGDYEDYGYYDEDLDFYQNIYGGDL